jgi:hypothetical protein
MNKKQKNVVFVFENKKKKQNKTRITHIFMEKSSEHKTAFVECHCVHKKTSVFCGLSCQLKQWNLLVKTKARPKENRVASLAAATRDLFAENAKAVDWYNLRVGPNRYLQAQTRARHFTNELIQQKVVGIAVLEVMFGKSECHINEWILTGKGLSNGRRLINWVDSCLMFKRGKRSMHIHALSNKDSASKNRTRSAEDAFRSLSISCV